MKVYVYTLGCRVNQCESESVAHAFSVEGWEVLNDYRKADLVVVNTCTVTSKAEQKARRMIRLFAVQCPTLVTGCYTDKELLKISDNVLLLPISRKAELLKLPEIIKENGTCPLDDILKHFADGKYNINCNAFDFDASDFSYHCRSYLKIQDGCDNNCGYCRTHIARGKSVFLNSDTVVERALAIEKAGYHEIILTGVNLTMYDHGGNGLGGLLEKLLDNLGSDIRIRLSSMEPDHIDKRLIACLKDFRMQPYFHIPIQSASDKVIHRVNRNYSNEHLKMVIDEIRKVKDDPLLACDIITGLPSEEDEDFEITKRFLDENGFSLFHVFPFSPRPDTSLFRAKDRVSESIRDRRAAILREMSKNKYAEYVSRQIGKPNEVILEEKINGVWYGLTGNYIKLKVSGVDDNAVCGELRKVLIKSAEEAVCL